MLGEVEVATNGGTSSFENLSYCNFALRYSALLRRSQKFAELIFYFYSTWLQRNLSNYSTLLLYAAACQSWLNAVKGQRPKTRMTRPPASPPYPPSFSSSLSVTLCHYRAG